MTATKKETIAISIVLVFSLIAWYAIVCAFANRAHTCPVGETWDRGACRTVD